MAKIGIGWVKWLAYGSLAVILMSFLLGVLQGVVFLVSEGDSKPLLRNTVGKLISADGEVYQDMVEYSMVTRESHKQIIRTSILTNLALIILNFVIGYLLIKLIFRIGISESNFTITLNVICILLGILLVTLGTVLYNGAINGVWDYPYLGLRTLFSNWNIIWTDASLSLANTVIPVVENTAINLTNSTI